MNELVLGLSFNYSTGSHRSMFNQTYSNVTVTDKALAPDEPHPRRRFKVLDHTHTTETARIYRTSIASSSKNLVC